LIKYQRVLEPERRMMSRRSILHSLTVLGLSLALIGCSRLETSAGATPQAAEPEQVLANGTVVDDIRVGLATECVTDPDCEKRLTLAKDAAIERHGLAPSAIGEARFYWPYLPPGAARGSGGFRIVVFDLDDGSQAAVTTFCMHDCIVMDPQPVQPPTLEGTSDHGPLVDPLVETPPDCASADHPSCNEAVKVAIENATATGFLSADLIADAHYYVTLVPPDVPVSAASKVEYIVDIYIAGPQDVLGETAIGVYCGSEPCQVVTLLPADWQEASPRP
jgi:hypothetical protein